MKDFCVYSSSCSTFRNRFLCLKKEFGSLLNLLNKNADSVSSVVCGSKHVCGINYMSQIYLTLLYPHLPWVAKSFELQWVGV